MILTWRTLVVVWILIAITPLQARSGDDPVAQPAAQQRPRIGVAFGGGSARGLAHVGVVRWFEEHRIPIDLIAGTSMGGLIGGGVAAGMSAGELAAMLAAIELGRDVRLLAVPVQERAPQGGRARVPSRIEFGIKRGLALPIALNNGQQVDFLLARIAGAYGSVSSFDELPTPFRAIAVDLVTAQQVVLDNGSLASAMRATMSLPGIFPPVERDGQVLVDGGAMNNVPADVVRGDGCRRRHRHQRRVHGRHAHGQPFDPGADEPDVDVMMQATTRTSMTGGRHRHQSAPRRFREPRLETERRACRGRIPGGRSDEGPAAAARGR